MMQKMETLPEVCQLNILKFIRLKDVLVCRGVSQSWNKIISTLWMHLVQKVSIPCDIPDNWNFDHLERSVWKILDQLNPNLADLSIRSNRMCLRSTEFMTALAAKFPSLRRLCLDLPCSGADLELISQFKELRFLRLRFRPRPSNTGTITLHTTSIPYNLTAWNTLLGSLQFLRHLHLGVRMCFEPPADRFSMCIALEKLTLVDVEVTDYSAFCRFIGNCPNLTTLTFFGRFWHVDPLLNNATDKLISALPPGLRSLCLKWSAFPNDEPFWSVMNLDQVWFKFEHLQELVLTYPLFKRSFRCGIQACLRSPQIASLRILSILLDECTLEEVQAIGSGSFKLSHLSLLVSPSISDAAVFKELVQNQPNLECLTLFSKQCVQIENAGFLEEITCMHSSLSWVHLYNLGFLDQVAVLKSIMDQLSSASPSNLNGIDFTAKDRRQSLRLCLQNSGLSEEDKAELMTDKQRAEDYLRISFSKYFDQGINTDCEEISEILRVPLLINIPYLNHYILR